MFPLVFCSLEYSNRQSEELPESVAINAKVFNMSRIGNSMEDGTIALGDALLEGFDIDRQGVEKIVKGYANKIKNHGNYEMLKVSMKKTRTGKAFMHHIKGHLLMDNNAFKSEHSDYNMYNAIHEVLKKILNEIEHKERTRRQENVK